MINFVLINIVTLFLINDENKESQDSNFVK